jgi:hypothetical protein
MQECRVESTNGIAPFNEIRDNNNDVFLCTHWERSETFIFIKIRIRRNNCFMFIKIKRCSETFIFIKINIKSMLVGVFLFNYTFYRIYI